VTDVDFIQDSDTNPNTTASSVAGDLLTDGRRRRSEATQLRKSILGKKHGRLDESKVSIITLKSLHPLFYSIN
jgi:SWI/SNF-related matrix-associated actin-dependent regulator of chromatin subfamily A member 5